MPERRYQAGTMTQQPPPWDIRWLAAAIEDVKATLSDKTQGVKDNAAQVGAAAGAASASIIAKYQSAKELKNRFYGNIDKMLISVVEAPFKALMTVVKPFVWFFTTYAKVSFSIILVVFFFSVLGLFWPWATTYAMEKELPNPVVSYFHYPTSQFNSYVTDPMRYKLGDFLTIMEYQMYGRWIDEKVATDEWYGVKMNVYTEAAEYPINIRPTWVGEIEARPFAGTGENTVTISCEMEDVDDNSLITKSQDTTIKDLMQSSIILVRCIGPFFDEIGEKDAAITVSFEWANSATLEVGVVDAAKFEEVFNTQSITTQRPIARDDDSSYRNTIMEGTAEYFGLESPNVVAESPGKNIVEIRAQMIELQPLPKDDRIKNLHIMVKNAGGANSGLRARIKSFSITTDKGLKLMPEESGIPITGTYPTYTIGNEYLDSLYELLPGSSMKNIVNFNLPVDISSFELEPPIEKATLGNIKLNAEFEISIKDTTTIKLVIPNNVMIARGNSETATGTA